MMAREVVYHKNPEAPREERCFFCYGTFEEEETLCRAEGQRIYHLGCLNPMLISNGIESLELTVLDGRLEVLKGFYPKHPRPRKDY